MATFVYIDGFNFYYGAVKNTPYKWLDVGSFCTKILPNDRIEKIRYFTAKVKAHPGDPDQPNRQRIYLRALRTLPEVEIHFGSFLTNTVRKPKADGSGYVEILDTEEKGSDVNLATYLVHDGHRDLYDTAVVISNDSDLAEAIKIVRMDLGKVVGVVNPHKHASRQLTSQASFYKQIRQGVLRDSQFPDVISDSLGTFHKPRLW
jgi:uncharacterized LabA/DUF88 family protein